MTVKKIGRGHSNDIVINDDTVSYHHAQIAYDGTRFFILDLNSTNGTYVNDKRIEEETQLFLSDVVRIGQDELPWHKYFAQKETVRHVHQPTAEQSDAPSQSAPRPQRKKGMFQHPFSFSGRIRRTEYWLSNFFSMIYGIASMAIIVANNPSYNTMEEIYQIFFAVNIPNYWFFLAQGAKRCHDINNSGWMQIVPLFNPFWMLFADSDYGKNSYGEPPKFH